MPIKPISIPTKSLTQSISSSASAFKVSNIKSWAKNALGTNIDLVAGDFGARSFCVFRNDTGTIIEVMEFDPSTIASASITILKRGLDFNGDPDTETVNYKLAWPAGTKIQFGTDVPQLLYQYPNITTGTAAPVVTPAKLGDMFIDSTNNKVYIATGTSSSADYKILN